MADLSSYLRELKEQHPDEIIEVNREIDARFQATAILLKLHRFRLNELPIVMLNNVRTTGGKLSPVPVVLNLWGSRRRWGWMLNTSPEGVAAAIRERISSNKKSPVVVPKADAPVREVVKTGAAVNLEELPALVAWRLDPGPYVNAGAFLCYDPDSGSDNSAILRGWLKNRNEIPWYAHAHGHTDRIYSAYEARRQEMRAAFWVGHHPAPMKAAGLRIPFGESHWEAMGALADEPIRLVPSETLGDDFLVPADAEYVIEGIVPVGERSPEGPYGEDWGHTGAQRLSPVLKVTGITHRRNPIWVNFITSQSSFLMDRRESTFRLEGVARVAKMVSPNVIAVRESAIKGGFYVKIRRARQGEAKDIGLAAVSAIEGAKFVFVLDDDVDIDNDAEALWALGSRTQWDEDVVIIPGARGAGTDPSTPMDGVTTKVVIDATRPEPFEPRNSIPQAVAEEVHLRDFFPASFFESLARRLVSELEVD
ncbi:MAG: UbiD family decarboxylase [Deltaproteobacteria bacterium]|nr:UbiD family decarboxylase [Deltaproteobacteria bacterium]